MTTMAAGAPTNLIRWHYLWYCGFAIAVMIVAINLHNLWFLNFVHVLSGLLWTGIDLFMGFVLGPILRSLDVNVRREVLLRLVPRTLFLMPTLAIITGTSGWYLSQELGFTALRWPEYGWFVAAMVLLVLPVSRSLRWLNLTCVLCIVGIWIEKGMGLVVPGFIPTPLGEIVEYTPTLNETLICFGIWAFGLLCYTVFLRIAVPILQGELTKAGEGKAEASPAAAPA